MSGCWSSFALLGVFHAPVVSCTAAAKVLCHVSPFSDSFEAEDGWLFSTIYSQCTRPWLTLQLMGAAGSSALAFGTDTLPRLGSAALHGAVERSQRQKESFNNCVYLFKNAWILDSCALAPESKEEQRGFAC